MRFLFICLITLTVAPAVTAQDNRNYAFKNASWYNGTDFTPATWYVVNGVFSKKAPSKVDSVIDLMGRWVIPPSGDAYSSCLADNPSSALYLDLYRKEGAFYVQVLSNTQEGRIAVAPLLNKAGALQAAFANGGITCTTGYPFMRFEGPAQGIRNPQLWGQHYEKIKAGTKMLGNGYWYIDNKEALSANWPRMLAQKPDILTIYLLDVANQGGKEGKGLTEEMAKAIIKKAHKAKIRVYAHVETVEDVRLATKLEVDGLANLPGHQWDGSGSASKYELSDDDLKKLAKRKTAVITLFSQSMGTATPAVKEFHSKTLNRLFDNGVNWVLGSDDPQRTGRAELNYWFTLGNISYGKILKVMCEHTPRAIFPKRKIGRIEDGFEASFIVLSDNPLENILKIRAIAFMVQNGRFL